MSDTSPPAGITENGAQTTAVAGKVSNRREPRLPLEFAVLVRYEDANGEVIRSYCKTLSVSVNGALLALNGTVTLGQSLQLTNVKTSQEVQCTVRSVGEKERADRVGIEFGIWSPEFWEITFPRQEGDPPVNPQAGEARPKTFLGRVRPIRANGQDQVALGGTVEGAKQRSGAGPLAGWIRRHKKPLIALLALLASAGLWTLVRPGPDQPISSTGADAAPFVLPQPVAQLFPNAVGYRLAAASDFAPEAAGFLGSLSQPVSGEVAGNFAGSGTSVAYVMVKSDNSWRVAIAVDGELRCDARYQAVAIAARIPAGLVRRITWSDRPSAEPDGDGLLIVRSAGQVGSAVVLFLRGVEVISGTPADYREIPALQVPKGD